MFVFTKVGHSAVTRTPVPTTFAVPSSVTRYRFAPSCTRRWDALSQPNLEHPCVWQRCTTVAAPEASGAELAAQGRHEGHW